MKKNIFIAIILTMIVSLSVSVLQKKVLLKPEIGENTNHISYVNYKGMFHFDVFVASSHEVPLSSSELHFAWEIVFSGIVFFLLAIFFLFFLGSKRNYNLSFILIIFSFSLIYIFSNDTNNIPLELLFLSYGITSLVTFIVCISSDKSISVSRSKLVFCLVYPLILFILLNNYYPNGIMFAIFGFYMLFLVGITLILIKITTKKYLI